MAEKRPTLVIRETFKSPRPLILKLATGQAIEILRPAWTAPDSKNNFVREAIRNAVAHHQRSKIIPTTRYGFDIGDGFFNAAPPYGAIKDNNLKVDTLNLEKPLNAGNHNIRTLLAIDTTDFSRQALVTAGNLKKEKDPDLICAYELTWEKRKPNKAILLGLSAEIVFPLRIGVIDPKTRRFVYNDVIFTPKKSKA